MNLAFPAQDRQSEKSEPTGPENLDSGSDSRPRSVGICPEDIGQYFCLARAWDPEAGDDIAGPASIPRIERGNRFHEPSPSRVRHADEEAGIGRALARIERDSSVDLERLASLSLLIVRRRLFHGLGNCSAGDRKEERDGTAADVDQLGQSPEFHQAGEADQTES